MKDEGRIRLIRRAPGMRLKEGNCAPFSPAFCDIYIEGVGVGAGGRETRIFAEMQRWHGGGPIFFGDGSFFPIFRIGSLYY